MFAVVKLYNIAHNEQCFMVKYEFTTIIESNSDKIVLHILDESSIYDDGGNVHCNFLSNK